MEKDISPEEKLENFIKDLDIKIDYVFIPFKLSKSKNDKTPNLNWKVILLNKNGELTTDYTKGIGHLEFENFLNIQNVATKNIVNEEVKNAVNHGWHFTLKINDGKVRKTIMKSNNFPNPTIKEVLYSLTLDSNALDYQTYEEWASDLGYEQDSRKGEKIFNTIKENSVNLLKILNGRDNLQKLKDIFEEIDNQPIPKRIKP